MLVSFLVAYSTPCACLSSLEESRRLQSQLDSVLRVQSMLQLPGSDLTQLDVVLPTWLCQQRNWELIT